MTDISAPTIVATTTASVSLASVLPGIDGNALIGAFAGATLFVMSAKELNLLSRIGYLLISLIMGYITAPEVVANTFIEESGVAAFLSGLLCITVALPLTRRAEGLDIIAIFRGTRK